jgi:hypothetical protein
LPLALGAEAGSPADVGIATFVEAEEALRRPSDADAAAYAEGVLLRDPGAGWVKWREDSEPKRARRAEIDAVEAAVDLQGLCETPGAAR